MIEHKVVNIPREAATDSHRNPLYPFEGVLESTLNDYAKQGWTLLSYDWGSWRHAVFTREVRSWERR